VVVLGPTASGKSEIACDLAWRFGGWILSVDSMAVYRGLEIGTSKPTGAIRGEIPHRGLDLADPGEDFSLGDYLRAADAALEEIRAAGAVAILVGGTGLYLRGLLKGIAPLPARDSAFRGGLLERERREGPGTLHRLLREVDPDSARRLPPADIQRIVRALELARGGVRDAIGKPGEEWDGADRFPSVKVGLRRDREELERRIRDRVRGFFEAGLVEETRRLLERYPPTANAFKALGYREVAAHLRGDSDLDAARESIVHNTVRYAKRQMTWFRKEPGVRWFDIEGPAGASADAVAEHVARELDRLAPRER
jgi:tRNA dimethylallyltransferase